MMPRVSVSETRLSQAGALRVALAAMTMGLCGPREKRALRRCQGCTALPPPPCRAPSGQRAFVSRSLARLRRSMGPGKAGFAARWNPPIPWRRHDLASARAALTADASGRRPAELRSCSRHDISRGPQAGQELVWEWNRLSGGSAYSRAQSGHCVKRAHRRVFPVEGRPFDDRVARPALRAGDERVEVAAVGRVEQLAGAVGAEREVRRDRRKRRSGRLRSLGFGTRPPVGATLATVDLANALQPGGGRKADAQARRESARRVLLDSLDLRHHLGAAVLHEAAQAQGLPPRGTPRVESRPPGSFRGRRIACAPRRKDTANRFALTTAAGACTVSPRRNPWQMSFSRRRTWTGFSPAPTRRPSRT